MDHNDKLAHSIRMKFGTSPNEPNAAQLEKIKAKIESIRLAGRRPTDADWRNAVALYCPSLDTHFYAGIDNSDLDTLLELATKRK